MSDLEKETYAWMGISPLVKLGRELVNPKTAIINVVPVGTLPLEELVVSDPTPTAVEAEDSPNLEPTESVPADDFAIPVVIEEPISEVAEVIETVVITEVAEKVVETSVVDEVAEIINIETAEVLYPVVDEPEELPENRRRKRRSSATVD